MAQIPLSRQMALNVARLWRERKDILPKLGYGETDNRTEQAMFNRWCGLVSTGALTLPGADVDFDLEFDEADWSGLTLNLVVYIAGVDVSHLITGPTDRSFEAVDGDMSFTLTLANDADALVMSMDNLEGVVFPRSSGDQLNGYDVPGPGYKVDLAALDEQGRFGEHEQVKRAVLLAKLGSPANRPIIGGGPFGTPLFPAYPIAPNKCIFQKQDVIRAWLRVPHFTDSELFLWMPWYTGYVNTAQLSDDHLNGHSVVAIQCRSSRKAVMARMRVSSSFEIRDAFPLEYAWGLPQNSGQQAPLDSGGIDITTSLFADQVIPSETGQPVAGLPIDQALTQLICALTPEPTVRTLTTFAGDRVLIDQGDVVVAQQRAQSKAPFKGVPAIEDGGDYVYDPADQDIAAKGKFMSDWYKLVLFGPRRRPWTREEVDLCGRSSGPDGQTTPTRVRLYKLVPADGSGAKNLQDVGTINTGQQDVNWIMRDELIQRMCGDARYQLFVGPTGDLFAEFDQSDFRPDDYGSMASVLTSRTATISSTITDEAEDPISAIMVDTGFDRATAVPSQHVGNTDARAAAFAPAVAWRFGMQVEQMALPYLLRETGKAARIAAIELSKRLASVAQAGTDFPFRPFLIPNRPFEIVKRTRIGTLITIQDTVTVGETPTATTNVSLNGLRCWTGWRRAAGVPVVGAELRPGKIYETVTGGESTPLSTTFGWTSDDTTQPLALGSAIVLWPKPGPDVNGGG